MIVSASSYSMSGAGAGIAMAGGVMADGASGVSGSMGGMSGSACRIMGTML